VYELVFLVGALTPSSWEPLLNQRTVDQMIYTI